MPVMIGEFQKAANLATGSSANAHAGPIYAIAESRKCISAARPGANAPEHDGYLPKLKIEIRTFQEQQQQQSGK